MYYRKELKNIVACGIALDIIKKELLELKKEEALYMWFEMDGEDMMSVSIEKYNTQDNAKEYYTSFSKWAKTNNFDLYSLKKGYVEYVAYAMNTIFTKLFCLSNIRSMKLKFILDASNEFRFCIKVEGDKEWEN